MLSSHQRRGLGAVVAAAMTRRLAEQLEHDVTALVNLNNTAACKIFDKLGFNLLQGVHYYWSMSLPQQGGTLNWSKFEETN